VAQPPAVTGVPAATGCPAAPYGARFYAPGGSKTVALTFDDGPGKSTAAILAILACAFRPPHGDYDSTTLRLAQQRRMGVWLWSVDTQDWMAEGSSSSFWVHRKSAASACPPTTPAG
jgi:peptidoglycan/xylan/chitin deacetylase (PgdA/CDA1 family)